MVVACSAADQREWLELRQQLWPHCSPEEHASEIVDALAAPQRFAQFIEYDAANVAVGFIELSLRSDYVNGTETSPVAFVEGIYVVPSVRRSGVARRLMAEAERWARSVGCEELASDAELENIESHAMHEALGVEETERVVFFRKTLE